MKKAQSPLVGTREPAGLHGTYYVGRGALRSPQLPPAFRRQYGTCLRRQYGAACTGTYDCSLHVRYECLTHRGINRD